MINDVAIKLKINENRELESITWPSITKSELFQEKNDCYSFVASEGNLGIVQLESHRSCKSRNF